MSELETILQQVRLFTDQHVPADWLQQTVPLAILCLLGGVGVSVFGAKMARAGFTTLFVALGGAAGVFFSQRFDYPVAICAAAGAIMIGIIGHQTFRLWVGVASAVVVATLAVGIFGAQRVMPHVTEFERVSRPAATLHMDENETTFVLPSPEQQQAWVERSPRQWASEFWDFVTHRDAGVGRSASALGIGALLVGLSLGVLAMRPALILSTSMLGTLLVATSMGTLLSRLAPDKTYQTLLSQPGAMGVAVGGFLVSSLILQALLTRRAPGKKQSDST